MASGQQTQALNEIISWLEQQVRLSREQQAQSQGELEQLRRQVYDLAEQVHRAERAAREVEPRLSAFKNLPEKLHEIEQDTENVRKTLTGNRTELEQAIRIIRAEGEHDRAERAEAYRRIEGATSQLGLVVADVAQVQNQSSQAAQAVQALIEQQREVEQRVEQFGLRLDRVVEVNRDLEERLRLALTEQQDDRFDVVFERLQVVGEMVKRNEEIISTASAEQTLREEVLQELGVWREEHARIDARLHTVEEAGERMLRKADELHGQIVLLEGRHSGLGERVAGIRREVAEIIDHVREEFSKYNRMLEKHRRTQIQALEQELRELKFHAFRPPEEH